ncbi:MAG: DNA repair protein RecO [Candidatus Omnitrophica bacterium]|nr:DNA repair protein RecO [Candidatus Omnitrophota bacterium]
MIEKDIGFVLKRHDFRETSVIVNLFTLRHGRITGILKGFYTLKKEFSSPLTLFSLNEYVLYPKKREIWLVSYVDLIAAYEYLRRDREKANAAAVCFRLVEKGLPLWEMNPFLFSLLEQTLHSLRTHPGHKVIPAFVIQFLTHSGVQPELTSCIMCRTPLRGGMWFSIAKGGLICPGCVTAAPDARPMSRETVSSFLFLQRQDFPIALRLRMSMKSRDELDSVLSRFCGFHLGVDLFLRNRTAGVST